MKYEVCLVEGAGTNVQKKAGLLSKNITIFGRRTSIRLEREMWKALHDIAKRENCSIHDICSLVSIRKDSGSSLTAAIRVFIMLYYKASSTEQGHMEAGHGDFKRMKARAGVYSTSTQRQESRSERVA